MVLGYGAHPDPAVELGPAIRQRAALAYADGRRLPVVASVTGTDRDPQGLRQTISALGAAVRIFATATPPRGRLAGMIVSA